MKKVLLFFGAVMCGGLIHGMQEHHEKNTKPVDIVPEVRERITELGPQGVIKNDIQQQARALQPTEIEKEFTQLSKNPNVRASFVCLVVVVIALLYNYSYYK